MSRTEEWELSLSIDELVVLQDLLYQEIINQADKSNVEWYMSQVNTLVLKVDTLLSENEGEWGW